MLVRVLQFLIGAVLAGGGGYLAWTYRADAAHVFPPAPSGLPLLVVIGLLGVTSGLVLLVSAVHPRPNQRRRAAEKAEREEVALGRAEAYYSQRARAADRDWRSGDITPLAPPAPPPPAEAPRMQPPLVTPQPIVVVPPPAPAPSEPAAEAARQRSLSLPPLTMKPAPVPPPAPPPPQPVITPEPPPVVKPAAKPVATAAAEAPSSAFPSNVTLAPLPRAAEPPPAATQQLAPPTASTSVSPDDPHADIRAAIQAGKLDEADKMLTAARDSAAGMDLALLTALAGDHAAVSGRQSHAKWLWRLALKRFGELDAMNSPAAKAVADSLRQAG